MRVHLILDAADWERWIAYFGDSVGASKALRIFMRDWLVSLDKKAEKMGVFADGTD